MDDFFKLDGLLTSEEKSLRAAVGDMVRSQWLPIIAQAYEKAEFPLFIIKQCAQMGLLGMTLPVQWGGSGASQVAYGLVCQELEKGDSGLRSFVSVQSSLSMYPIYQYGSELQKQRYLAPMAKGELIGCFGLTEANAGSDPGSMTTYVKKVPGGYYLNGAKLWITNATIADIAIVWAKIEDNTIRGFIVEKQSINNPRGFKAYAIPNKLSLRASMTGELVFEDCFIPDENLLPGTDIGLVAALGCLTKARYGIAWGTIGAAMACYEIALEYTKIRTQFGKPLASCQLVQKDLVDMLNEILKAQLLNLHLGRLHDKNEHDYTMVSLAKMNACSQALKIARMARNLLGANGISLEYHVMRHMANLESVFTYEGTDNMHHLIVGKQITGYSAF